MTAPSDPPPRPPPVPVPEWVEQGAGWRRQHPLSLAFLLLQNVRVIPLLVLAVMLRGPYQSLLLWGIILVNVASACLHYWRFRYRFTRHELEVEQK